MDSARVNTNIYRSHRGQRPEYATCARAGGSATNCNDPSTLVFVTIGAAITAAAPGDVSKVCPSIYNEQVTVSKPVTIRGDDGAILKPTAMVANTTSLTSGLDIAAAILVKPNTGVLANVVIESLTIDGAANGFGDCATNPVGIYYRNASGTISKVAVKNFKLGPGLLGCQVGLGILVQGVTPGGAAANVIVQDSSVNEYQKNGAAVCLLAPQRQPRRGRRRGGH